MVSDTMLRVAAVQMNSGLDPEANRRDAEKAIRSAAREGAQLIVLPELFSCLGDMKDILPHAESIPGPTSNQMCALAQELQIYLCAGSICEKSSQPNLAYNTSLMFGPKGELLAKYRKIHLFDIDLPDRVSYRESQFMLPGEHTHCTPIGATNVGQATCYDLRFPELFRVLTDQGATLFAIPAAFTKATGEPHWQVLLRARAIENQCFVVAANQCGSHGAKLETFGHSQIIDPWGRVLAEAQQQPQMIVADLDLAAQLGIRSHLPCLQHRRQFSPL
ncbi:MAG: carbon-nitrogen hydrolase family protein [Planctomycetota bacterium]|nr:carbon-nitrogen hydrolase family protein [Planctomycetota bacterium]MDA1179712.1 carbon-nitrogen hydrolase family protein [Planctomycetota bacterium]